MVRGVVPPKPREHGRRPSPTARTRRPQTRCCVTPTKRCTRPRGKGPTHRALRRDLRGAAASRLALISELRHAETNGELRLVYQPVMGLADEKMVGVDSLKIDKSFVAGLGQTRTTPPSCAASSTSRKPSRSRRWLKELRLADSWQCCRASAATSARRPVEPWSPGRPAGDLGPMPTRSRLDMAGDTEPAQR